MDKDTSGGAIFDTDTSEEALVDTEKAGMAGEIRDEGNVSKIGD